MIKLCLYIVACIFIHVISYRVIKHFRATQAIYELSPQSHQEKANTPTMGGIGIFLCILLGFVLFYHPSIVPHIWVLLLGLSFAVIGLIDDLLSIKNNYNKGLSARHKFLLQVVTCTLFLVAFSSISSMVYPLYIWLFYGFVIIGSSNATNLTDGLDGLLAGLSSLTFFGFFVWTSVNNQLVDASLAIIFLISCLTFLVVNRRPAKIFMGDTGSLGIGALMAGFSIYLGNPWLLLSFGAIYVLETCSVIIQVLTFKLLKKRLFLMSPLHHHFELLGLTERQVVWLFWGLGFGFIVIFFMIL